MVTQTIEVKNDQGMHMRPAGVLAGAMAKHKDCSVTMTVNGKNINAKAVMQIMAAGIKKGTQVEISCDGVGEKEALGEAVSLFEGGFGE